MWIGVNKTSHRVAVLWHLHMSSWINEVRLIVKVMDAQEMRQPIDNSDNETFKFDRRAHMW